MTRWDARRLSPNADPKREYFMGQRSSPDCRAVSERDIPGCAD